MQCCLLMQQRHGAALDAFLSPIRHTHGANMNSGVKYDGILREMTSLPATLMRGAPEFCTCGLALRDRIVKYTAMPNESGPFAIFSTEARS